jgi:hypothetical protein
VEYAGNARCQTKINLIYQVLAQQGLSGFKADAVVAPTKFQHGAVVIIEDYGLKVQLKINI